MDKIINNKIQESYVSFAVAKMLRDVGFRTFTRTSYYQNRSGGVQTCDDICCNNSATDSPPFVSRPTHAVAIEWLLVNFNIHIFTQKSYLRPILNEEASFCWVANIDIEDSRGKAYADSLSENFNSSYEAIEAALLYVLNKIVNDDVSN